jgi:NAD kinase
MSTVEPNGDPRPALRKVTVIVKETYLDQVRKRMDQGRLQEIADRKRGLELVQDSHQQHVNSTATVISCLERLGITCELVGLQDFKTLSPDTDMVVVLGGDGTFLGASHMVGSNIPVLGVNSAPLTSFGHFCITDASGFEKVMQTILAGKLRPLHLLRIALTVNGKPIAEQVLNEVLVASSHPAATSRLDFEWGKRKLNHRGSGLIVAAPAGSTGFLRSEGGLVLPITARSYTYQVRAPFLRLHESHEDHRGVVPEGTALRIICLMERGKIYIDGEHIEYDFPRGAVLEVTSGAPLSAFVDPDCHHDYIIEQQCASLPVIGKLCARALTSKFLRALTGHPFHD